MIFKKIHLKILIAILVSTVKIGASLSAQTQISDPKKSTEPIILAIEANQPEKADSLLKKHFGETPDALAKEDKALFFELQGDIFLKKYDYKNALGSWIEALKIYRSADMRGKSGWICIKIGDVFVRQEQWKEAEQYFIEAQKDGEAESETLLQAEAGFALGKLFLHQKIIGTATGFFQNAIDLTVQSGDFKKMAEIATYFGKSLRVLGDYEGSVFYLRKALDAHRATAGDENYLAGIFNEIALSLLASGDIEEAMMYNQQAFQLRKKLDDPLLLAESHKNFAAIFSNSGDAKKAKLHLDQSKAQLQKLEITAQNPDLWLELATLYKSIGETEAAYQAQSAYIKARDYFFNNEKATAILELNSRYQSENKTKEQQNEIQVLKLERSNARQIGWILALLLLAASVITGSLFYISKTQKRDNQLLQTKNELIEKQKTDLQEKNTRLDVLNKNLLKEIQEREALERSSFERDRFLASMSHRMGVPLNSITGLTYLLQKNNPRPDQFESLKNLQFAANHLTVFINDVLDYSKIEAGKLTLEELEFQPRDVFREIREQYESEGESKGLKMHFLYDPKIPKLLKGDPARLNQILSNLLNVALKNAATGSISTYFELLEELGEDPILKIEINASGKPIDDIILNSVFSNTADFQFLEQQNEQTFALTIAKRLTELQNGKLEISNREDNIFKCWIPFKMADKKQSEATISENWTAQLAGNRILVVEDNKINQLVVSKILRDLGVEVSTANDGLEALEIIGTHSFDLILMDIQMPNMDGYRATSEIRNLADPVKKNTPIIALTASAFLSHEDKAKLFGMNDHVGKPFSPKELIEKIARCLSVRKK